MSRVTRMGRDTPRRSIKASGKAAGEMRTIATLFCLLTLYAPAAMGTTHTIISSGFTFAPESLRIAPGDSVQFVISSMHNAVEGTKATWDINDTTSNGGFSVPFGGGTIVLSDTGIHYYVCQVHISVGMKGRIVVASPDTSFSVNRTVAAGWNMVSLPVGAADRQTAVLFPGASSRAFAYDGVYRPEPTLSTGAGYWLKFNNGQTVPLTGSPVVRDTINALKGWNMIGSLAIRRPHTAITSAPSGIVNSPLFGFDGSYFVADTLVPGFGYWVRLSQAGKLMLDTTAGSSFPRTLVDEDFLREASRLLIRDGADHEMTLYVLENVDGNAASPSFAESPPIPPPGAFDIRFASGRTVKLLGENESGEFPILLSSISYPMTVMWEMQPAKRTILLGMDGRRIGLTGAGAIRIATPLGSLSLVVLKTGAVPSAYALSEPFPNPFNPVTIIGYSLPYESRVIARVYNVLGQPVATLVDAIESAGVKSVAWNAGEKVSGIYFVRLDAAPVVESARSFTRVAKVILQK